MLRGCSFDKLPLPSLVRITGMKRKYCVINSTETQLGIKPFLYWILIILMKIDREGVPDIIGIEKFKEVVDVFSDSLMFS